MTARPDAIAAAVQRAGAVYAEAKAELDDLAASGGPNAVIRAAAPNGTGEEQERLAAYLEWLQRKAAQETAAA